MQLASNPARKPATIIAFFTSLLLAVGFSACDTATRPEEKETDQDTDDSDTGTGEAEVDTDTDSMPEYYAGFGCSPNGSTPVCNDVSSVLANLDLGSCPGSLGFFYNGTKCEEVIGCEADQGELCFFETGLECATACSKKSYCNEAGFKSGIGHLTEPFPEIFEVVDDYCDRGVYACFDNSNSEDFEKIYEDLYEPCWTDLEEPSKTLCKEYGSSAADVISNCSISSSAYGTSMDFYPDEWKKLCAVSLLPNFSDFICKQMTYGSTSCVYPSGICKIFAGSAHGDVQSNCEGDGGTYSTGWCDETDLLGTCNIRNSADDEIVEYYYSTTHTAEQAEAACTAGNWLPHRV